MVLQSFKMAWKSILSNKMRSLLTMLGIIIGIVSLVVLVSIAKSATSSVTDSIASMGTNLLTVTVSDDKDVPLTIDEVMVLADEDVIDSVAPIGQSSATAKKERNSGSMTVYGTTGGYYDIQGLELAQGRFLKSADVTSHTYVAIINEYAAEELFESTDVVGESFSIDGRQFLVIGVLAEEESIMGFNMSRMEAYIPYTTLVRVSDSVKNITTFYASATSEDDMDPAETFLTDYMLERLENDEDAFSIQNQSTLMETMSSVTDTLAIMLGGIAAISLLVGGIGIMNIMLVSVTERTREIGIRKAIGASPGSILLQFLIEALVISLLGCAFGIMISGLIIGVVGKIVTSMTFTMSVDVVIIAVAFSAFVGVVFGSYPAKKAANKKPIDALRY